MTEGSGASKIAEQLRKQGRGGAKFGNKDDNIYEQDAGLAKNWSASWWGRDGDLP